jgi:hypothetical protein
MYKVGWLLCLTNFFFILLFHSDKERVESFTFAAPKQSFGSIISYATFR